MSTLTAIFRSAWSFLARNPKLLAGGTVLLGLLLVGVVGPLFVDVQLALPISVAPNKPPSAMHWLGTDSGGREILAVLVAGTPQTLRMGLLAGFIGVAVGVALGVAAGFFRGMTDRAISAITDTMLTIPPLAVLLVIAVTVRSVSVELMAVIIAALSWMNPARSIRAQVLSLRELAYVHMARLSGASEVRIVVQEILPNLIPIAFASFVGATSGAVLAGIGLEVLGLGPQNTPTLGMTIYWALLYAAFGRGMWWWWAPPIVILIVLFVGLFMVSVALDEVANPRLRRKG
jgi:peptide/nickel transport system permease protein